jgi:hypothetical protein
MSNCIQQWLRQQVRALPAVRTAHPLPEAAAGTGIVVRTWVGMSVNIYFLDGIPNLRALRRVLHENTRTYQATMFIAHHGLMPPDHKRLIPDEWMHALHELNSERIYSYLPDEQQLRQVHFDYMPDGVEREAWHGSTVAFQNLRVLNVSAKTRTLRGQWMMADFGPNPYWRTSDYRAERLRARFRHGPQNFAWAHYDAGAAPGGPTNEALNRVHIGELERCFALLGVGLDAEQDEVKAAFRKLAREYHPDVSTLDKTDAEARFRELTLAYETIKTRQGWA